VEFLMDIFEQYSIELSVLATIIVGNYIRYLGGRIRNKYLYALVFLPGTVIHELFHAAAFIITSILSFRFPRMKISLWPKTNPDGSWTLGSVSCSGINFFNAFPVALAPALMLLLPVMAIENWDLVLRQTSSVFNLGETQTIIQVVSLMAWISHSSFPSRQDFKVASSQLIGSLLWATGLIYTALHLY